ncbi:DUF1552 domain-containing protein [uncultured Stenotrophomonas sp.]|uniref:DUF1552 domain-containing protein n=1 Tax=uncultured Stenotrophomonas sp. TaxID=165438 RepID=UPI0028D29991|nr:DUF1552 domain-containing protein [uncultured Stenotrophomonas sp.]
MSISVSRRRLLLSLAAAGGLGALGAGAYYLNRTSLARWAVDGRELKGALQGGKPKVVFVILADGLGTLNLNNATPDQAAPSDPNDRQIWHPWDGEVGNNSYRSLGLDVEGPLLAMLSSELEPYRSRSLYIRGTSLATNYEAHSGWTSCLRDNNKAHASIDHIIGQKLSNYAATQKAVFCGHITHNPNFRVSYSGGGTAIRDMQSNPHRLFASLFPDQAGRSRSGGKHVFDPALADLRELKEGMSPRERQKLESHLDAIEQVQNDLDGGPVEPGPGCDPTLPEFEQSWLEDHKRRADVLAATSSVLATALACGATRVATFQVGASSENQAIYFDPYGDGSGPTFTDNAHEAAHHNRGSGPDEKRIMWQQSRVWYVNRLKTLLDDLARHPDPDVPEDSLLDHTLVVVTSELSDGRPETSLDMPLVMIGGTRSHGLNVGNSNNGRFIHIGDQGDRSDWLGEHVSLERIWTTVAQSMGVASGYSLPPVSGIFRGIG